MKRTSSTCLLALAFFLAPCAFLLPPCFAQDGNPRHPGVVRFERIGGYSTGAIWPLGDISGDGIADIAIEHFLDTGAASHLRAQELLILHGIEGGLPVYDLEKRLEPGQLLLKSLIKAVGDWDGQKGPDLCVYTLLFHDTTFGNADLVYDGTGVVIIYWNDGTGHYSLADTSRLFPEIPGGFAVAEGTSGDWDRDGVEDLFLKGTGTSRRHSGIENIPKGFIYRGHQGKRWGRDGISNTPDWQWWNVPNTPRLDAQDLNQDSATDLILYSYDVGPRPLSVLYGQHDETLPDTLEDLQQVDMATVGGKATNFADVTGDQIPDLTVLNPSANFVYIYVGCKGQRLLEQFGTGNDPPQGERWWGKPWAAVKGPNHVNSAWFGLEQKLFDLGSADTNGTEEIWIVSQPYLLCYDVGGWVVLDDEQYGLDSLFDGQAQIQPVPWDGVLLGDIDGDSRNEFAIINFDGVHIYRMGLQLPKTMPSFWHVPDGRKKVSGIGEGDRGKEAHKLDVQALPNPSSGEIRIRWRHDEKGRARQETRVRVTDMVGQEVISFTVANHSEEAVWDASKTFGGTYFITATVENTSQTISVVIR